MTDRVESTEQESMGGSPPELAFVSASASVGLWRVLNALRDGWFLESRLHAVARMIADDARARGLRAEQMIVAIKNDWPKLLERRRLPGEAEVHMLAERLVSFCIHEYYAVSG